MQLIAFAHALGSAAPCARVIRKTSVRADEAVGKTVWFRVSYGSNNLLNTTRLRFYNHVCYLKVPMYNEATTNI